jgi:hypothetical protein
MSPRLSWSHNRRKRAQARYAVQLAEHEAKLAARAAKKERGESVGGKPPAAPTPTPEPKDQYNFTDPERRIMKAGNGQHFKQSCTGWGGSETGGIELKKRGRSLKTGLHPSRGVTEPLKTAEAIPSASGLRLIPTAVRSATSAVLPTALS